MTRSAHAFRNRMRTLPIALVVLLAAPFAAAVRAQSAADTIVKQDGSPLRGVEVTSMTLSAIKYLRNKEPAELPAHAVIDVRWGNVPDAFVSATAAMQRSDFETARQLFGDSVGATDREVLKVEARFQQCKAAIAAAGAEPGAAATAAGAMRAWLGEFADGWRVPEGMLLLGRALRLGKMNDDAATALKELDDRSVRDAWSPAWGAHAKYELALCMLDQGKAAEARNAFQGAASAAENALLATGGHDLSLKAIQVNARVGEGESLVSEKQYQRAVDFFRSLANNEDPSLVASGKAGEGEALFLLNADGKDGDALRRAQVALAQACVLDTGAGDTCAKANYYLGQVVLALGEREGNEFKNHANAYFQIVTRNYAGSRWASAAQAQLGK